MYVDGFGSFLPFGEISPGTLFLDQSSGMTAETAILLKVADPEQRYNCIRIFDRALVEAGHQMPSVTPCLSPDKPVLALLDFFVEIESCIDNVVWESDVNFVKAAVLADGGGVLCIKAYRNRNKDDYDFLLFQLIEGYPVVRSTTAVGFRRWSILCRNDHGERVELFRFDM